VSTILSEANSSARKAFSSVAKLRDDLRSKRNSFLLLLILQLRQPIREIHLTRSHPMRLMIQLIPNKQHNRSRNRNITCNEIPPIEWIFKCSEPLDEQDEDIQEQVESINPDRTPSFEWICRLRDPLFVHSFADAEVSEDDSGPGNIRC